MTVTAAESRLRKEISHVDQKVEEVKKIAKKFENVDINDLMQTLSQNLINYFADSRDKFVEFFKTEMVTLEAKIREICTDLWKRTMVIEEKVFQTSSVTNLTLFNVQEILKRGPKPNAGGGFDSYTRGHQQQGYYPTSMAGHSDRIILKINQLGKDIEYNFKTLLNNQIQFKDGCKRIQDGEVHIERTIEGYLIRIHENFVNETLNMKGLLEAFYGTDLQMSQKLEDIQIVLEQNNNIMIGDAKKIFTNLNVLRDSMNQYFKEFTVETVATKVSEDLKPILLKFVDEAVLAPTNFTQNTDGIFEELETIITLNKNNTTEESPPEVEGSKADSQRQEDDYGDSAVDLTEDEAS